MAKQAGDFKLVGTFDDLCYYKFNGKYCVRRKSSLTSKQFWKAKVFEGSRKSCKRFGEGNSLASKLYRSLDEEKRIYKLFCFLKKRAIALLKQGNSLQQTETVLKDYLVEFGYLPREDNCPIVMRPKKVVVIQASRKPAFLTRTFITRAENVDTG